MFTVNIAFMILRNYSSIKSFTARIEMIVLDFVYIRNYASVRRQSVE